MIGRSCYSRGGAADRCEFDVTARHPEINASGIIDGDSGILQIRVGTRREGGIFHRPHVPGNSVVFGDDHRTGEKGVATGATATVVRQVNSPVRTDLHVTMQSAALA